MRASGSTIAFFNTTAGIGQRSLVYHLAWMFSDMGRSVLAVDLDPQSNLTSMFLKESELEELWPEGKHPDTILGAVNPLIEGLCDSVQPTTISIAPGLSLIAGDLGLGTFEDRLSMAWSKCLDDAASIASDGFRVVTALPSRYESGCGGLRRGAGAHRCRSEHRGDEPRRARRRRLCRHSTGRRSVFASRSAKPRANIARLANRLADTTEG